jgi:hypothetical protein
MTRDLYAQSAASQAVNSSGRHTFMSARVVWVWFLMMPGPYKRATPCCKRWQVESMYHSGATI